MACERTLASKIEKSKRYAKELTRIQFENFRVKFRGDHGVYIVSYDKKSLTCTCPFFQKRKTCSHTMAIKRIFGKVLKR